MFIAFLKLHVLLAWLTPDPGNHMHNFSYLRCGLQMPGAVYWVLRISIKCSYVAH